VTGGQLAAALAACGFRCVECGTDRVRLDSTPAGYVPVISHWQLADGSWCPALDGGPAARLASLDLLDALAAHVALADYGEFEPWHRRQRAVSA
jgi:hypothetical protein